MCVCDFADAEESTWNIYVNQLYEIKDINIT